MKYNKELIEIVKNQKFKTFWHCLDYLLLAGYKPIDAFGITMQEFGESKVFSDVAFIKVQLGLEERHQNIAHIDINGDHIDYRNGNVVRIHPEINFLVRVGLIDSSNIHLSGL